MADDLFFQQSAAVVTHDAGSVVGGVKGDDYLQVTGSAEQVDALIGHKLGGDAKSHLTLVEFEHSARQSIGLHYRIEIDGRRHPQRFTLEQITGNHHWIAADIPHRAAANFNDIADVFGIPIVVGKKGLDRPQIPYLTGPHTLPGVYPLGA